MTTPAPLVTVTCLRDIAMLELQAQGLNEHYQGPADIFILVNERFPDEWRNQFNKFKHYYNRFNLTVMFRDDFDIDCDNKHGWDDQQLLKLAISQHIYSESYFVLDTQNILVRPWNTSCLPVIDGKIPYRTGGFALPLTTWHEYNIKLGTNVPDPAEDTMSFCTPLYFKTSLAKSLIESQENLNKFSWWFRNASRIKSEFILYYLWAEKNGGFLNHHYSTECWANPYLRDSKQFSTDVNTFIEYCTLIERPWVSINHRAWGDMSEDEYSRILQTFELFKLYPKLDQFRKQYFDERLLKRI